MAHVVDVYHFFCIVCTMTCMIILSWDLFLVQNLSSVLASHQSKRLAFGSCIIITNHSFYLFARSQDAPSFPKSYPVVFFVFCRPIRKSLTASRSWLKPMMRDWTSSSKNPPSWWMLNKQPKRTSTWVGWWDNIEGWSCSGSIMATSANLTKELEAVGMFRCSMLVVFGKGLGRLGLLFRSLERQNCTALHSLDWVLFPPATLWQAHQQELDSLQRLLDDHDERLNVFQQESNQLTTNYKEDQKDYCNMLDWYWLMNYL